MEPNVYLVIMDVLVVRVLQVIVLNVKLGIIRMVEIAYNVSSLV